MARKGVKIDSGFCWWLSKAKWSKAMSMVNRDRKSRSHKATSDLVAFLLK